ncbi:MAG: HEAT repeat domain-containing protein [Candidatus Heimdallarchaeaceae archaeon]
MTETNSSDDGNSRRHSEIEALIKQLKYSSIPIQRERAAYLLANFRDSRVIEALLHAQLTDPNPRVRDSASQSLAALLTADSDEEEEIFNQEFRNRFKDLYSEYDKELFSFSLDVEIIRKGVKKSINWKDSLELKQLFNAIERDRYLHKQQNIRNLINSIIMLPINNAELGRDIAIALTEILRVTSDETVRLTAIGSLNNIITSIDRYNPIFGIAEAFIMIFKASDDSDLRIASFKCLETIIQKRKSLSKLSQYIRDIVKLLTFSYEQKIREIALFAYPDLVLVYEEIIPYLVDIIIGIVRATYEDRLREMGLKALEAILVRHLLTEQNVERIVKILKSHHNKNIRIRGIELFTQITLQASDEKIESALNAITELLLNTRNDDICYTALQLVEKTTLHVLLPEYKEMNKTITKIATTIMHPFVAIRAFHIMESLITNNLDSLTKPFLENFIECLMIHREIGVMEQILIAYIELTTKRDFIPQDVKQYLKTILYISPEAEIQEIMISFFREVLIAEPEILPEKLINKFLEITHSYHTIQDIKYMLENIDINKLMS